MEWRIELIACGNYGLRNSADGWLPSFIMDFLLLFAGLSALTYVFDIFWAVSASLQMTSCKKLLYTLILSNDCAHDHYFHLCRKYTGPCAYARVQMIEINLCSVYTMKYNWFVSVYWCAQLKRYKNFVLKQQSCGFKLYGTETCNSLTYITFQWAPKWVSEQMHEQSGMREQSEQVNEWAMQAIERKGANGPVLSALMRTGS